MEDHCVVVWAGFVDGHLDYLPSKDNYDADHMWRPALFRTRAEARRRYRDVRRLVIDERDAIRQ
jgi:hypothetical protein